MPLASLNMSTREFTKLPGETRNDLTRLGFAVVSRLGLEHLQVLAAAGAGPWGYLEDAGLSPSY